MRVIWEILAGTRVYEIGAEAGGSSTAVFDPSGKVSVYNLAHKN
jgi:hypothetical protein